MISPVIENRREHHYKKANTHFHTEMMGLSRFGRVITQVTMQAIQRRKVTVRQDTRVTGGSSLEQPDLALQGLETLICLQVLELGIYA